MNKKSAIFILSLALLIIIGYLDYTLDPTLSLLIFYLIPIFLAAWFVGLPGTLIILFGSVALWLVDDCRSFSLCIRPPIPYWNLTLDFILCCFFICGILLIKRLFKKLEEFNERKSAFVSHVSHEFKNPLSVIKEAVSLTLEDKSSTLTPKQKEMLGYVIKDTRRLIRLVTDLLDLSKIEAGKMELKKEKVDMASLVNEIIKEHELESIKKNISIEKDFDGNVGFVSADKDKLTQAIINLLSNAIKYSPRNSRIRIGLKSDDKETRFEIYNEGVTIAKENFNKIFDKFERIIIDNQEGTGLGLPITKDIIDLHKGKIWVESAPDKGSTFIFTLPK